MAAEPRDGLTVSAIVDRDARRAARGGERGGREARRRAARAGRRGARGREGGGRLELRDVSVAGALHDFSLRVAPGEIVGLAGVAGAGHHAVLELVCGMRRPDAGSVTLPSGRDVPHGLRRAIRAGVALVSGDRRRLGLMLDKPLWENIGQIRSVGLAADGPIVRSGRAAGARPGADRGAAHPQPLGRSGRRVAVGRQPAEGRVRQVAGRPASVILLDDPTRGVDVGAKAEMHALIRSAAAAGAPVLICSTDIDELASLCDRVVVLHQGQVSAELAGDALSTHAVLEAMNTERWPDQGSNVASCATTTSSSSGSSRSASAGSSASSALEQLGVVVDALARRSPARAPARRCRPSRAAATGRGAVALGEPVHDRVAAVDEHDEQHAGAVAGRAPQRGGSGTARSRRRRRSAPAGPAAPSARRSRRAARSRASPSR